MGRKTKIKITIGKRPFLGQKIISIIIGVLLFGVSLPAVASYIPFNTNVKMNIGIGTSTPQGALVVTSGNVGIGTWTTAGGNLIVNGGGNVGIGSAWPGQLVDVQGTVRALYFVGNGSGLTGVSGAISGLTQFDVPVASNATTIINGHIFDNGNIGIGSINPGQLLDVQGTVRNIGEIVNGNVGMGTSFVNGAGEEALAVMNGNVGIGTWVNQAGTLEVNSGGGTDMGFLNAGNLTGEIISAGSAGATDRLLTFNLLGTTSAGDNWIEYRFNGASNKWYFGDDGTSKAFFQTSHDMRFWASVSANSTSDSPQFVIPSGSPFAYLPSGNNLGVGSSAPGQVLDVQGTARMTGFTLNLNPNAGYVLVGNSIGVGTWMAASTLGGSSGSGTVSTGTINQMTYYTANGTTVASLPVLTTDLTNIGIGTSGPSSLLDVNRKFNVLASGNVGIGSLVPGQVLDIQGTVRTSLGAIFNGNVGISSSAPGQKLDVQGTVRNIGEIVNGNVGIGTAANQAALSVMNGNVGIGTYAPTALFQVGGVGNVGINSAAPGAALDVNGGVRVTGFTLNLSPVAGDILMTNGVGVGTWVPASSVASGGAPGGSSTQIQYNNGGSFGGIVNSNVTATGNIGLGTVLSANKLDIQGSVGIGTAYAGYTSAPPNGLIVQGNVGIGTRFPESQFVLYATSPDLFVDDQSSTDEGAYFVTNAVGNRAKMAFTANGNAIPNALYFQTQQANSPIVFEPNSLEAMRIISGGNVGIGSTNPGQILDVKGTARMTGFTLNLNPNAGYVLVGNSVGVGTWMAASTLVGSSGSGIVSTGTINQMAYYTANGTTIASLPVLTTDLTNIGIGTSGPSSLLDVNRKFNVLASGNVGIGSLVPGQALDIQGTVRNIGQIVNGNVGIGTSFINGTGEAALTIMNGNVGIGTWAPSQQLTLTGNIGIGSTTAASTFGVIYKGGSPFISDFNYGNNGTVTTTGGNTFIGVNAGNFTMGSTATTVFESDHNTAIGALALTNNTIGADTDAEGWGALNSNTTGIGNTAVGAQALLNNTTGGSLTAIGFGAGENIGGGLSFNQTSNNSTYIGSFAEGLTDGDTNETVIGYTAIGYGSNTITFGNAQVTATIIPFGNVGIGSTAPGQKLDVNGTVRMKGFTLNLNPNAGYVIVGNSVGVGTWMPVSTLGGGSGTVSTGTIDQMAYYTGNGTVVGSLPVLTTDLTNIGIGTSGPSSLLDVNRKFNVLASGNVGIGSITPGQLLDVNGTVRVFNGNVGIGTARPGQSLDVNGEIRAWQSGGGNIGIGTTLTLTGIDPGYLVFVAPGINASNYIGGNDFGTGQGNAYISASTTRDQFEEINTQTYSTTSGATLLLAADDGAAMTAGNQIGRLAFFAAPDTFHGSNANPAAAIEAIADQNFSPAVQPGDLLFLTNDVEAMRIMASGNVGIGSINPGQILDVKGTVRMTGFTLNLNPNAGYVMVGNSVGVGTWMPASTLPSSGGGTPGGSSTQIQYNNSGSFGGIVNSNVTATGNIGLGTTLSTNKLDIQGAVGIGTAYAGYTSAPSNGLIVQGNVGIGSTVPGQALDVQGTVRIFNGNVGIGTATPEARLDVSGSAIDINGANGISYPTSDTVGASIAIGIGALSQQTTPAAYYNTAIGYHALNGAMTGGAIFNTAIGYDAMSSDTGGNNNIAIGYWAMLDNNGGSSNTAIGVSALQDNVSGTSNTAIGLDALQQTTGSSSTAIGDSALQDNVSGSGNTAVGVNAFLNDTGSNNTALGYLAGQGTGTTSGSEDTFIGFTAGQQISTGTYNTTLGYQAGYDLTTGSYNTILGNFITTGVGINAGSNNIIIGQDVRPGSQGGSNQLNIGNLVYATGLGSGTTASSGNVGIGTTTPQETLQVLGNVGIGTSVVASTPYTLSINNVAVFNGEYNNGTQTSNFTVNWAKGNKQAVTINAAGLTANFTNPATGVGMFQLKLVQGGSGSSTITTWTPSAGSIYWAGGAAPVLSTTAGYVDILSCYYDATNYYCTATTGFAA